MITISGLAVVGTKDKGTVSGGLSDALNPGKSACTVASESRLDLKMSTKQSNSHLNLAHQLLQTQH